MVYGPPLSGKSKLSEAIAQQFNLEVVNIKKAVDYSKSLKNAFSNEIHEK
jgi:replication-associated recombination protein RarA